MARTKTKSTWAVIKDVWVEKVVVQSVHDSEKGAKSAARRNGGVVQEFTDNEPEVGETLKEYC